MSVLQPRWRRRLAIGLLAFGWLAQQLGAAAHGEMQRRLAAGGGIGEICTSAGLVHAPADAPAPAEHAPAAAVLCDVCAGATLAALAAAAPPAFAIHVPAAAVRSAAAPVFVPGHSPRAHRPRAPPTLLS